MIISASAPKTRLPERKRRGGWAEILLGNTGESEGGSITYPFKRLMTALMVRGCINSLFLLNKQYFGRFELLWGKVVGFRSLLRARE